MDALSPARAVSAESTYGEPAAADTFDVIASLSSTPPTSVADSSSVTHDAALGSPKLEVVAVPIDTLESHDALTGADIDATMTETTPGALDIAIPTIGLIDPIAHSSPLQSTPTASPRAQRTRRSRVSEPIYNLSKLSGTDGHGKRRSKGDVVSQRRRRTTTAITRLESEAEDDADPYAFSEDSPRSMSRTGTASVNATPKKQGSIKVGAKKIILSPKRTTTRSAGPVVAQAQAKTTKLGKRKREAFEQSQASLPRELRRLQDTKEFQGIDDRPVLHTVWANGKFVDPNAPPPRKKAKVKEPKKETKTVEPEVTPAVEAEAPAVKTRRVKKWLPFGLYAGQDYPVDPMKGLTASEKKAFANLPELAPAEKINFVLPPPQFAGLRLLIQGRDFQLPFDICNPLPPGQPKPKDWRTMTKNRFIGDARAIWKKTPHLQDYQSNCVCTPEDGCGESCQNRIMLYECDHTNCNVGIEHCQNRAFARLTERTKAGGKYRVGVEVIKTEDRGYGIRANRCFEPNQIIMEYTGEIITEDECDRRMNEKYKDNECYYLMLFDQNMIIDATTGSIARFVNHSCRPNCQMIKWIVSGQPRMALFAGDKPIQTGDELTYDYNFDPFSAKNVQKCLCGADNCRGVLGPKPKEVKPPKVPQELKKGAKKTLKGTKRKLGQISGAGGKGSQTPLKKRKIKTAAKTQVKKPAKGPIKTIKAATAAMLVKKSVSKVSVKSKASAGAKTKVATIRKTSVVKTVAKGKAATKASSVAKKASPKKTITKKTSSSTIVAASADKPKTKKSTSPTKPKKNAIAAKTKGAGALGKPKKTTTGPPRYES
ncbi:uncharacterized protein B0I36DRAFT_244971 [Microdochium trichocladiopsis]|uniref:Histone-lysine N-methyltransferase ASH1L n=1 Tax=Microdochium trichocladiopsis TaxID=1682393 RepID=A0A9P8Y4W5_9PEZI|nr:uncharacterized protein B0I36DRAFT_244971 [Microdochium trichocladiopsis]KAH7029419.1 hypothetical protein B0I36DRAFT_244971 [Microdochium trichocladiopsis]